MRVHRHVQNVRRGDDLLNWPHRLHRQHGLPYLHVARVRTGRHDPCQVTSHPPADIARLGTGRIRRTGQSMRILTSRDPTAVTDRRFSLSLPKPALRPARPTAHWAGFCWMLIALSPVEMMPAKSPCTVTDRAAPAADAAAAGRGTARRSDSVSHTCSTAPTSTNTAVATHQASVQCCVSIP